MTISQKELGKWNNLLTVYKSAIDVLSSQVKLVVNSFSAMKENDGSKSIQKLSRRIKSYDSILGKLKKKGVNFTIDEIDSNIHDVIGLRIVCLTMSDVKNLVELLCKTFESTPDIKIIETKDYINDPKPSGYRAYHIQLKFKVFYGGEEYNLNAEIQVKTTIMDAWAELEHRLRYKYSSLSNLPDDLKADFELLKQQFDLLAHSGEITDNMIGRFITEIEKMKCAKKVKPSTVEIPKQLQSDWEERLPIYQKADDVLFSTLRLIYESNKELMNEDGYSWVQKFNHRIKSIDSVVQKLNKKGLDNNIDNIESSIHDLLGFRIVCLTQNDLYTCLSFIEHGLARNSNIKITGLKDSIQKPKSSGYRGVHIQLVYKVNYLGVEYEIPAEIQLRTVLMDSWAELEQKFKYKEEFSSKLELTEELENKLVIIKGQLHQLAEQSTLLDEMSSSFIKKSKEQQKVKLKNR